MDALWCVYVLQVKMVNTKSILGMWSSLRKEYFSDNFAIIIWRKKKKNNTSNKKWPKKVYGWLNSMELEKETKTSL